MLYAVMFRGGCIGIRRFSVPLMVGEYFHHEVTENRHINSGYHLFKVENTTRVDETAAMARVSHQGSAKPLTWEEVVALR